MDNNQNGIQNIRQLPPRQKMYVSVNVDFLIDGTVEPKQIRFADGRCFNIQRVKGLPNHNYANDPSVTCFPIIVNQNETKLYMQKDCRWFVLAKVLANV